ncbi:hypothetical protein SLS58_001744 [Diplodia intermedia]|uniref:Uncharacterized protein n=1 Tax=Diplodia intermedia TaxID=856260 RepID=A0ABR3U1Q2_9PEZI
MAELDRGISTSLRETDEMMKYWMGYYSFFDESVMDFAADAGHRAYWDIPTQRDFLVDRLKYLMDVLRNAPGRDGLTFDWRAAFLIKYQGDYASYSAPREPEVASPNDADELSRELDRRRHRLTPSRLVKALSRHLRADEGKKLARNRWEMARLDWLVTQYRTTGVPARRPQQMDLMARHTSIHPATVLSELSRFVDRYAQWHVENLDEGVWPEDAALGANQVAMWRDFRRQLMAIEDALCWKAQACVAAARRD